MRFETYVREAFFNGEDVVSIFFDLEKAYDTTCVVDPRIVHNVYMEKMWYHCHYELNVWH